LVGGDLCVRVGRGGVGRGGVGGWGVRLGAGVGGSGGHVRAA